MNTVYRVAWKSKEGKWRYVVGKDAATVFGEDAVKKFDPDKPLVFTDAPTAERVARAITDRRDVVKVVLRKEGDELALDGAGKE